MIIYQNESYYIYVLCKILLIRENIVKNLNILMPEEKEKTAQKEWEKAS